jgi:hypothetical protein
VTWQRGTRLVAVVVVVLTVASCGGGSSSTTALTTPLEKTCGSQVASEAGYRLTSSSPITVQPVVAHPKVAEADIVNAIKGLCIVTIGSEPARGPATTRR